jgi:BirA family biotin operon repressor/biotin-[acetyl-CoA-carboxylase] ligase
MNSTANWPTQQIERIIAPHLPDFHVEVLTQIDSSNSELMRRARNGQMEPVLLVAEQQTAGRGRMGRQWFSGEATSVGATAAAPGRPKQGSTTSSLTFSLGLPLSPHDWSGLSLLVGLSIVGSLHADLRLKWPNDVWLNGRKMAGILIETTSVGSSRYAVVGIGINITEREGAGLANAPAWLQELLPGIDPPVTLLRIAAPLVQAIKAFEQQGFAPFQARFNERDALYGLDVALSEGSTGVARGVNSIGALQLQTARGLSSITSSEVSVRPLATPAPGAC